MQKPLNRRSRIETRLRGERLEPHCLLAADLVRIEASFTRRL